MELKAAVRALVRRKAVVAFQCLALTFGLGTLLLCANLFGVLRENPSIPGVACGSNVKRLALMQSNGALAQRFTYAQAKALVEAAPGMVSRYAGLSLEIQMGQDSARRGSVVALDPQLFEQMCIKTASGQWPANQSNQAVITRDGGRGILRIGSGQFEVSGLNTTFFGLYGTSKSATYIPISSLENAGVDTGTIDLPSVTLLLNPGNGGVAHAIEALGQTVRGNPSLFGVNTSLVAQAILPIGAEETKRLAGFSKVVAIVGIAFLALGLLTVVAYQFGRIGALAANLALIRELGAPRVACLRYSLTEPASIFLGAIATALPLEFVLRKLLSVWLGLPAGLTPSSFVYGISVAALIAISVIFSLAIALVILRLARTNMSRRARRLVQKTFQYVSALQVAVCLLTMLPAIAAMVAYSKAVPSTRGYDISSVRVHPLFLAMDMLPAEFTNRAPELLKEINAQIGGTSAISTTAFPLPGEGAWDATVNYQGKNFNLEVNAVTASYFKVIQLPVVQGQLFGSEDQPTSSDATPTVAVANREAARLLRLQSLPSSPLIIGKDTSAYRATISVIGVVDEKTSGTDAADSMDRLRPAIYIPWKADGPFLLSVRHPADMSGTVVDNAIWKALDQYLPVWRQAELPDVPTSLEALYLKATAPQRTMLYLFSAIAAGAMLLAFAGLLGSGLMALGLNLKSLAVKYTLGATRRELAWGHFRTTAAPLLVALTLALVIAAIAAKPVAEFMQLSLVEIVYALAAALLVVFVFGAAGIALSCRGLLRANLTEALRSE